MTMRRNIVMGHEIVKLDTDPSPSAYVYRKSKNSVWSTKSERGFYIRNLSNLRIMRIGPDYGRFDSEEEAMAALEGHRRPPTGR